MNWTDERVEKLKKLWAEGLSASQIAAQLGGVSRNAVIGKVHRLSLPGRAKAGGSAPAAARPKRPATPVRPVSAAPATQAQEQPRAVAPRPAARATSPMIIHETQDRAVALFEDAQQPANTNIASPSSRKLALTQLTDRTCKWPIGDPMKDEFHFCGNDAPDTSPYCTFHARLAYQPSAERRRMR